MGFSRQEHWSGLPLPPPESWRTWVYFAAGPEELAHKLRAPTVGCTVPLLGPNSGSSFCSLLDGEGNGTPLQYSCLENPTDGGAWWAAIYGVVQSRTRLKRLSSSSSSSLLDTLGAQDGEGVGDCLPFTQTSIVKVTGARQLQKQGQG